MTKHTQKQSKIRKLLRKLGRLSLISGCVLYIYILMFSITWKKVTSAQQPCSFHAAILVQFMTWRAHKVTP